MHVRVEQLPCKIDRDVVVPSFLEEMDHPWLQRLIERAASAEGILAKDLDEHLLAPLPMPAPPAKQRLAASVLTRSVRTKADAAATPKDVRERIFVAAAKAASRADAIAVVASDMGITPADVIASMFADLKHERVVSGLAAVSPGTLAANANLWLAQAYISRATRVSFDVKGGSRSLVLSAKAKGLLCTISGSVDGSAARLDLSGPMSLFRKTRLYGRALSSLLPALAWCDRWIVDATCCVGNRNLTFRISTGAPIMPSDAPRRFDSKVEERFAKDFAKARLPWSLIREPRPVVAGDALVFPDFALEQPGGPSFLIELIGFWTPAYLEEKLARYRKARIQNLILCIDQELSCGDGTIPEHARVIRFKKRIDVLAVLAATTGL